MFAWSDRHHDTALARAFHTPGREIQRLVATKEPTAEQLEVGIAALAEILARRGGRRTGARAGDCHVDCRDVRPDRPRRRRRRRPRRRDRPLPGRASRWSSRTARPSSRRESRRSCSTSATGTSSCCGRSARTPRSASSSSAAGPGLHHVAYAVDDIDAALARAQGAPGIELIDSEPRPGHPRQPRRLPAPGADRRRADRDRRAGGSAALMADCAAGRDRLRGRPGGLRPPRRGSR